MTVRIHATCPLCAKRVPTLVWHGRRIYEGHGGTLLAADYCEGSGWLVEDDELLTRPRKQRSDAGVARKVTR